MVTHATSGALHPRSYLLICCETGVFGCVSYRSSSLFSVCPSIHSLLLSSLDQLQDPEWLFNHESGIYFHRREARYYRYAPEQKDWIGFSPPPRLLYDEASHFQRHKSP